MNNIHLLYDGINKIRISITGNMKPNETNMGSIYVDNPEEFRSLVYSNITPDQDGTYPVSKQHSVIAYLTGSKELKDVESWFKDKEVCDFNEFKKEFPDVKDWKFDKYSKGKTRVNYSREVHPSRVKGARVSDKTRSKEMGISKYFGNKAKSLLSYEGYVSYCKGYGYEQYSERSYYNKLDSKYLTT